MWLDNIKKIESPNFDSRPDHLDIDLLVIHCISLPPEEYGGNQIEEFFVNKLDCTKHPYFANISGLSVSAHFLIKRTGECVQFVSLDNRAWHAGKSSWQGRENCNDYSIGIELEGIDTDTFTDEQYAMLIKLTKIIMRYYPKLSVDRIVGHSDVAPGRKKDPGVFFDWSHYKAGLI